MKFDLTSQGEIKETVNREAEAWDEKDVEKLLSNFTSIRCCHLSTISFLTIFNCTLIG
ncbi:MAG TPA: hypothetical protein VJL78_02515 [Candidatus Nitrosocosmicus sp.]|nr:hypothetical protein [Candidatus Nitrosocosmicus sp.]